MDRVARVVLSVACLVVATVLWSRVPTIRALLKTVAPSAGPSAGPPPPTMGRAPFEGLKGSCELDNYKGGNPKNVDFRRVADTSAPIHDLPCGDHDISYTVCERGFRHAYADRRYGTEENPHPFSTGTGADGLTPTVGADEANKYAQDLCNAQQICIFKESQDPPAAVPPDSKADRRRWAELDGWNMYEAVNETMESPVYTRELERTDVDLPRPFSAEQQQSGKVLGWRRVSYLTSDDAPCT
jgi:hypothetical protein